MDRYDSTNNALVKQQFADKEFANKMTNRHQRERKTVAEQFVNHQLNDKATLKHTDRSTFLLSNREIIKLQHLHIYCVNKYRWNDNESSSSTVILNTLDR